MSARIYIEGGGDSKELKIRCREGFRRLFRKLGLAGRLPQLVACGPRSDAFNSFRTAHQQAGRGGYVAMLVDSEDPVADIEMAWDHLQRCDKWEHPDGATDDQVLLMVTCMETWIVADRETLKAHYDSAFQENALPALEDLEARDRDKIQTALQHATRNCKNAYAKGKRSFEIVGKLEPKALRHLPSFARIERILQEKL